MVLVDTVSTFIDIRWHGFGTMFEVPQPGLRQPKKHQTWSNDNSQRDLSRGAVNWLNFENSLQLLAQFRNGLFLYRYYVNTIAFNT